MKSSLEVHNKFEGEGTQSSFCAAVSFAGGVIQIGLIDIVVSLDLVIVVIGMANRLVIMALAVVFAVIILLLLAKGISAYNEQDIRR